MVARLAGMRLGTQERLEKMACLPLNWLQLPHFLGGQAKSPWRDVKKAGGALPWTRGGPPADRAAGCGR